MGVDIDNKCPYFGGSKRKGENEDPGNRAKEKLLGFAELDGVCHALGRRNRQRRGGNGPPVAEDAVRGGGMLHTSLSKEKLLEKGDLRGGSVD